MDDLVAKLKADPGAVCWGGGSAGGTDHIARRPDRQGGRRRPDQGQLHRLLRRRRGAGGDPRRPGDGRRLRARRVREPDRGRARCGCSRVSGDERIEGVDAPTLKEAGVDVALENWRMVAAAPGITDEEKAAITADIEKLATSDAWKQELATRGWDDRFLAGADFDAAARRRHRGDQGHPDRHRAGAVSARVPEPSAAPTGRRWSSRALPRGARALVVFWQTRAMPVAAQYARVGPTTAPYVMSGFLALLAIGHVVTGLPPRHAGARGRPAGADALDRRRAGAADAAAEAAGFSIATGLLFAFTAQGLRPRAALVDRPARHRRRRW